MKNPNDTIWHRARERPACGAMPQPTTACPLPKNKRMSKLYLIFRSHEEVSTNSTKTACIQNIGTILYLHSRTRIGKPTLRRGHVNAKWWYSLVGRRTNAMAIPQHGVALQKCFRAFQHYYLVRLHSASPSL